MSEDSILVHERLAIVGVGKLTVSLPTESCYSEQTVDSATRKKLSLNSPLSF